MACVLRGQASSLGRSLGVPGISVFTLLTDEGARFVFDYIGQLYEGQMQTAGGCISSLLNYRSVQEVKEP